MSKSELDELIEKSLEQAKETCICEKCYKEKATPLIFPILEQQKVILISEAPYNFPPPEIVERRELHWTKYFKQDFKCFIYCELGPYLVSPRSQGVPKNIFDFISLIFHPLLKECKTKEHGIKTFLNNVYWTHMAKKSLKGISKNGAISKCLEKFHQEFNRIYEECGNNIKLFIVCTSYFYNKFTKYPKWELITAQQFKILETEDRLLKIDDILVLSESNRKVNSSIRECIEVLKQFKDCHIAFFPNPSKANIKRIREFFARKHVNKLLNKIYGILQSIQ